MWSVSKEEKLQLEEAMLPELSLIPNSTHPDCVSHCNVYINIVKSTIVKYT